MLKQVAGMDNSAQEKAQQNANAVLSMVQSRFCLIRLSNEIRILDKNEVLESQSGKSQRDINFYKKADGELLIKRYLETLPHPSDTKKVINQFWINPNTFMYDAVAFSPLSLPATTLNYWVGHTANPKAGKWSQIISFLYEVICDHDEEVFNYLMHYIAHMLQKPEEKPGIMIVMLGAQGTGKGAFFTLMRRIWSKTTLQVSDVDQVIGRFNASLERNYIILMDEALFAGDKKSIEKLKSLITESRIGIEQKYQPAHSIDSYHRFFAASNNSHFAQIDRDDRRFLFLRVSSEFQGNTEYYKALFNAINDDAVINAMVHKLLQTNLSTYNVTSRPKTKEHLKQKIQSLSGFDRYWYEVLGRGTICGGVLLDEKNPKFSQWPIFIPTHQLVDNYRNNDKNAERYQTIQTQTIAEKFEKLCPSATQGRHAKPSHYSKSSVQVRGYHLPTLNIARREFEVAIGGNVDWDWSAEELPTEAAPPDKACSEGVSAADQKDLANV
jgi:hypothetical protein